MTFLDSIQQQFQAWSQQGNAYTVAPRNEADAFRALQDPNSAAYAANQAAQNIIDAPGNFVRGFTMPAMLIIGGAIILVSLLNEGD